MRITGIDPQRVSSEAEFLLGTLAVDDDHNVWFYGRTNDALSAGSVIWIGSSLGINSTDLTTGTQRGMRIGVVDTDWSIGDHGWAMVYGSIEARHAAAVAAANPLYTTATAGALDDNSSTAGADAVHGISFVASVAAAGRATARLNWPVVGSSR